MPRVGEADRAALPAELWPLYDQFSEGRTDFTNQVRVMARSPEAFRHLYGLLAAWKEGARLPRRLVEIAVVTVSRVNDCPYCVGHHGAVLVDLGLSPETVAGILEPQPPGLDDRDLAVRDYARLVTERAWGIPDAAYARLQSHLSDDDIVELTVRVGLCSLFNKLNQALQVDIEDGVLADIRDKRIALEAQSGTAARAEDG